MGKYDGYRWIRVPVFVDDPSKSWEERFKALDAHHKTETTFLIEEVRKVDVELATFKGPFEPAYCGVCDQTHEVVKVAERVCRPNEPIEEKYIRKAQTKLPGGKIVERDWTTHERYMLFAKGFSAGAGGRARDPQCEGLGAYDRGYDEGIQARRKAVDAYAKEIGYVLSILRAQDQVTEKLTPSNEQCHNCFDEVTGRCIGCRQCSETGLANPPGGTACPDCLLPLAMGCDCARRTD